MKRPLLCTTVSAKDCGEMARKARLAISMGSDLVELRLDHLMTPEAEKVGAALSDVVPKSVLTNRPTGEGGRFRGNDEERLQLLGELAQLSPAFLDIELELAWNNPGFTRSLNVRRILSWHDFEGTPPLSELSAKARDALSLGDIAKIVTTAKRPEDVGRVLSLYRSFEPARLVAFSMGEAGVSSRAEAIRFGSPLAYCSLDSGPVAPGQLPFAEMRDLLRSSQ